MANNTKILFLASLNLPYLRKLTNDNIANGMKWPPVPTKLPSDIPKLKGNNGKILESMLWPFTFGAHLTTSLMTLFTYDYFNALSQGLQ